MTREGFDPGLEAIGWHPSFAQALRAHALAGRVPARVVAEERGSFVVHDGVATILATVTGRFRYESGGDLLAYPAVGDWVALAVASDGHTAAIHELLPRRSAIVRRAPSDHATGAQTIAANVDVVFIVTSLNAELNLRRLERYLAVAWDSGALPVVILSKADLDDDILGHKVAVASGHRALRSSRLRRSPARASTASGRTSGRGAPPRSSDRRASASQPS